MAKIGFVQSEDTFRTQPPSKWGKKRKLLQRQWKGETNCIKRDECKAEFRSKGETVYHQRNIYHLSLQAQPLICDSAPAPLHSVCLHSYLPTALLLYLTVARLAQSQVAFILPDRISVQKIGTSIFQDVWVLRTPTEDKPHNFPSRGQWFVFFFLHVRPTGAQRHQNKHR